jgi:hypothetical protein
VLTAQGDKEHATAALKNGVTHLSQTVDSGHPALRNARQLMGGDSTAT